MNRTENHTLRVFMGSHGFIPFRREFMPVEVRFQKHHANFERWRCVSASIDVFLEQCRGKKIVEIEALPGVKEDGNTRDDDIARYRGWRRATHDP